MIQFSDPGGCSFSSLPRATSPRLLSCVFGPLCLSSAKAHEALQMQTDFCVLALQHPPCISSHLSLADRNPAAFHSWMLSGFLSWLWCCSLGSPAWGLDPTLLRVNSLAIEISLWNFSHCLWEPSQLSQTSSALPTSHVVVKWFLLSDLGYKASFQLVFHWIVRMVLYNSV